VKLYSTLRKKDRAKIVIEQAKKNVWSRVNEIALILLLIAIFGGGFFLQCLLDLSVVEIQHLKLRLNQLVCS
jgi:hypothetical protein